MKKTTYHVELDDWDNDEGWQPCVRCDLYEDSGDDNDLLKPAVFTSKIEAQEFVEVLMGLMRTLDVDDRTLSPAYTDILNTVRTSEIRIIEIDLEIRSIETY